MTSDELRGAIKLIAEAPGDDDTAAVSGEKFQVALLVGYEIALQLAIMNERAARPEVKVSPVTFLCTDCHQRKPFTEWIALPRGELRCPNCLNGRPIFGEDL